MTRVDVVANERLLDDRHAWHEIQEFWQDRPVALVFLRQFGSAFASQQANDLAAVHADLDPVGNVVLIGLGTPIQGFGFRKRIELPFPLLATSDQTLYRTMGLWRSWIGSVGPANWLPLLRLARGGTYPIQRTGDVAQLGGAFVVTAGGGAVPWEFRARNASDVAPAREIAGALAHAAKPAFKTSSQAPNN